MSPHTLKPLCLSVSLSSTRILQTTRGPHRSPTGDTPSPCVPVLSLPEVVSLTEVALLRFQWLRFWSRTDPGVLEPLLLPFQNLRPRRGPS